MAANKNTRRKLKKPSGILVPEFGIRLLYAPCSSRLAIQILTHVVLLLLLRRLLILGSIINETKKSFNFRRFIERGAILTLDESVPSPDAASRDKKIG